MTSKYFSFLLLEIEKRLDKLEARELGESLGAGRVPGFFCRSRVGGDGDRGA